MENDIFNTNKNLRDYDENPIIVKNYEQFFTSTFLLTTCIVPFIPLMIYEMITEKFVEPANVVILIIFIGICIFGYNFLYTKHILRDDNFIKFKSQTIEFYEYNELQRIVKIEEMDKFLSKPFWAWCEENGITTSKIFFFLFFVLVLICGFIKPIILVLLFFIYLAECIKKAIFFRLNNNFSNFTPFPALCVASEFHVEAHVYNTLRFGRYCLVYIFSENEYKQLKEWFFRIKKINIDNIKKSYYPYL